MSSYFTDPSSPPDPETLLLALGRCAPLWKSFREETYSRFPQALEVWKYYGAGSGWVMKFLVGNKNLFFVIPLKECFRINFVLGEKAVQRALSTPLPVEVEKTLREGHPYPEGRSISLEISQESDLSLGMEILGIKLLGA
ncbi:MAG: hypothetical protein BWY86_00935 [Candidatus Aminicenantes bacterium ADurb.Bin508]|nr:MAG: hypothetical protein BWY86_00935 [Candidatus Aminicenantes bacterium ADurb.Bin508]HNX42603.1 DUF3788 family protein [Candidatus Aminicenantes bacterium]HPB55644.1 DUF3788 family protein [Candidatus Aminicenantes bacterium]HPT00543.1 DUF3788 family protein [Candidatus Aminicenantes bacterium]